MIYLAAVVGPTLVVLAAGAPAVRRQAEALDTLQVTTRALQEARIAEEVDRQAIERAGAALRDPRLAVVAALPSDAPPEDIDRARDGLRSYHLAHPIVQDVVVIEEYLVVYPRVEPPLPERVDAWVLSEPAAVRATLGTHVARAEAQERTGALAAAAQTYGTAAPVATTTRLTAWLLASAARCAAAAGDHARAIGIYHRLIDQHAGLYTPAGRPHAVSAAIELRRLGALDPVRTRRIVDGVIASAWTMSASQVSYALAELGADRSTTTAGTVRDRRTSPAATSGRGGDAALERLERASLVRDELVSARPGPAGEVRVQSVTGPRGRFDVAQMRLSSQSPRRTAVTLDANWLRDTLVPMVADGLAPNAQVRTGDTLPAIHPGFRTILPGWRVAIAAPAATNRWIRADLLTFSAAVGAVLGVLVMGVVLLRRDVNRETALNQMRADLVSGVSHELKAPISVIRAYAETLEDTADATPGQRHEFTRAIVEETDRLRRLVDDVVDFSRIQQGQRVYQLSAGFLAGAVARAVDRFRRYAELHGFEVSADLPDDGEAMRIDADAVEQAVLNLLDNAAKYGGDAKRVAVRLRDTATEALVEVRDEGPGIPAAERARIFERFHRGPHEDRGGYGLGLYLVRHVMDAHGGTVTVQSEPGHGSLFTLHFPREAGVRAKDSAG